MIFKTAELRGFLNKAKAIQTNNILPILSYIKYEDGTLSKTNLRTFYSAKISTTDKGSFLINENIIANKLKEVESDTIKIELDGKFVVVNGKTKFPTDDAINFPKLPEAEKAERVTLDGTILKSLGYARNLTMISEQAHNLCFVHLTDSGIYVSNNHTFARFEFYAAVPALQLTRECCSILSEYNEVEFYTSGNHYFFSAGDEFYAFLKSEAKTPIEPFKQALDACVTTPFAEFDKKDLVGFCDFVSTLTSNPLPFCELSIKNKVMTLNMNDSEFETSETKVIDAVGGFEIAPFQFNPKIFSHYLKSIPYSLIRFSPFVKESELSVTTIEDEQFLGILIGINKI